MCITSKNKHLSVTIESNWKVFSTTFFFMWLKLNKLCSSEEKQASSDSFVVGYSYQ